MKTASELGKIEKRMGEIEVESRAAILAEDDTEETDDRDDRGDHGRARACVELRERVEFSEYIRAALNNRGETGAERRVQSSATGIPEGHFPLSHAGRRGSRGTRQA